MTTSYLIDGYNLLHAMGILVGKVKPLGLERARLRLQEYLVSALGDETGQATVVFDASRVPPRVPREQIYKGLTILLAVGHEAADDVIETLIARHASPKHLIVVSSDRRLQTAANRKSAQAMGCTEFLDFLEGRRQGQCQAGPDEPEKQVRLSAEEITGWLQEFAGLEEEPDLKEALKPFDFE